MYFKASSLMLLSEISAIIAATVGQIPLTAEPTEETTTTTTSSSPSHPTISYTTTLTLPDLNLHINAAQLSDPELEQILSSAIPGEMLTLLVSATAGSVSDAAVVVASGTSTAGNIEMAVPTSTSLGMSMRGGGWRGNVAATTTEEVVSESETVVSGEEL